MSVRTKIFNRHSVKQCSDAIDLLRWIHDQSLSCEMVVSKQSEPWSSHFVKDASNSFQWLVLEMSILRSSSPYLV